MQFFISRLKSLTCLLTLVSMFTLSTSFVAAETLDRPFGDVKILSTVPFPPGFPEGIAVKWRKGLRRWTS